jgi:hypothetical protein
VDINTPTAMFHTHDDGLLLVTPRAFKEFAGEEGWMALQSAVTASGYTLTVQRRHVHAYRLQDAKGVVGKKALQCVVLVPSAIKCLFDVALPESNASILGRA